MTAETGEHQREESVSGGTPDHHGIGDGSLRSRNGKSRFLNSSGHSCANAVMPRRSERLFVMSVIDLRPAFIGI